MKGWVGSALTLVLVFLCGAAAAGAPWDRSVSGEDGLPAALAGPFATTGILYDRVAPLSEIHAYDGSCGSPPIDLPHWRQIYYEIYRASIDEPTWPEVGRVRELAKRRVAEGVIPIALMDFSYNRLEPGALAGRLPTDETGVPAEITADQIRECRVFAAAALKAYTDRGASVAFSLGSDLCFTNSPRRPTRFEIDFGDGLGFRPTEPSERHSVSYPYSGKKLISLRAQFADGAMSHASFHFDVRQLQVPTPHDTLAVTASIPYLGGYGTGEAYVYYGESHVELENPVLVIEGFDIDNTMNWEELYEDLNQEGLIETLRTRGYDAVVLNFTEATDYIQSNAFVVVELIQHLNSLVPPGADLAVIGASMGGLCGRYALAYMEDQGLDHNTRTYISFDTPQRGANIPLGIQYWVKLFSIESEDAAFLLERLSTPAARRSITRPSTRAT